MCQGETGFEIEVLSGEEEARRTLLGIAFGLPSEGVKFLGLDIGGGSTELFRSSQERLPVVASLELGVVRLTERCFQCDPPRESEVIAAEKLIRSSVQAYSTNLW